MAKEKNLTAVTSVAAADFARVVTSAGASVKATFANVAKYIVETYNGSTVAGSAQSVKSALDSLNSKTYNVVQVTATTTADGAVNLSEWVDTSHRVISVVPEGGSAYYVAFPLFRSVNYAMVYTWPTLAKAASVSVTLNVYYR